mgnify:CR=1 FL=1
MKLSPLARLTPLALVVGLFLVYNTVAVSVIARRSEIGILRALGTTRRTLLSLFLGEAALLAGLGVAIGLPTGWLLAKGAVRLTATTVNALYITSAATVPPLTPSPPPPTHPPSARPRLGGSFERRSWGKSKCRGGCKSTFNAGVGVCPHSMPGEW